ncbi:MAG: class I SAM-dependent methyltransferase [Alphaproteobacteria bacterium]|nr:class I SAM-dependent methyltransferase [Alphaproteobacteria bacterium]
MKNKDANQENDIIEAWHENAAPWIDAIQKEEIESRTLVTNQAIIDAVMAQTPKTVLDIGCGEGWLARRFSKNGINVHGIDVIPELVQRANAAGGGEFQAMSYEDLAAGKLAGHFDAAVCNFSLIGDESTIDVFRAVPKLLNQAGIFIVQTLHPVVSCGDLPYEDGWREGSWAGFSNAFKTPAPWYLRTLETWIQLHNSHGFNLTEMREPLHPRTKKPASVIFTSKRAQCQIKKTTCW